MEVQWIAHPIWGQESGPAMAWLAVPLPTAQRYDNMSWYGTYISNLLKFTKTQISKSLQGDTCCHHRNFFWMSALCHLAIVANSLASTLAWNSRSLLLMHMHNAPTYRYSLAAMTYHIEAIYISIYRGNTIPQ